MNLNLYIKELIKTKGSKLELYVSKRKYYYSRNKIAKMKEI